MADRRLKDHHEFRFSPAGVQAGAGIAWICFLSPALLFLWFGTGKYGGWVAAVLACVVAFRAALIGVTSSDGVLLVRNLWFSRKIERKQITGIDATTWIFPAVQVIRIHVKGQRPIGVFATAGSPKSAAEFTKLLTGNTPSKEMADKLQDGASLLTVHRDLHGSVRSGELNARQARRKLATWFALRAPFALGLAAMGGKVVFVAFTLALLALICVAVYRIK
jgi:hypothetical protein